MTIRSFALGLSFSMLAACGSTSIDRQDPVSNPLPATRTPASDVPPGSVRLTLTSIELLGEDEPDHGYAPAAGRRFLVLGARVENGGDTAVDVESAAFAVVTTYGRLALVEHGPSSRRDATCAAGRTLVGGDEATCSLVFEVSPFSTRYADADHLMFRLGDSRLEAALPHEPLALDP